MNDLRSQNRTLTPVPEIGPQTGEILTNPAAHRARKRTNPLFENSRPIEETGHEAMETGRPALARPPTPGRGALAPAQRNAAIVGENGDATKAAVESPSAQPAALQPQGEPLSFPVSRELRTMPVSATATRTNGSAPTSSTARTSRSVGEATSGAGYEADVRLERSLRQERQAKAPSSRPSRRREVAEEVEPEDDKFPWHHQFDDDGPQELQAKSPLLSRAFRSSVG